MARARTQPAAANAGAQPTRVGVPRAAHAPPKRGVSLAPDAPVGSLSGVGPARRAALAQLGIERVRELAWLVPRALEPLAPELPLECARARVGERVRVRARLTRSSLLRMGRGRSTLRLRLEQEGARLDALFFNQPWLRKRFEVGQELVLEGRIVDARGPALAAPRVLDPAAPLPERPRVLYPLAGGLGQELLRQLVQRACAMLAAQGEDPLPAPERERLQLLEWNAALRALHEPANEQEFAQGRRRAAFEGLVALQHRLQVRRTRNALERAPALVLDEREWRELLAALPFALTAGQAAIAHELRAELARARPMRRLLQGDVGSGKTALALIAAALCARCGAQAAILAPTELVAEQHALSARDFLRRMGCASALLTGALAPAERARVRAELERGAVSIVFGTHALLGPQVRFARLALAVIDEQQRFGVAQRRELLAKGAAAHALLMTATPIPRTLALAVYGELDAWVLREKPPGRGLVHTRRVPPARADALRRWLAQRFELGESAYWVVPRIDSGPAGVGLEERAAELARGPLAPHGIARAHGRAAAPERQAELERFHAGSARLLLATSVIEVGLDVPRARVIVIEGAERFGLAQLHQLRGRVGRSAGESWCLLLAGAQEEPGERAQQRLALLERESDGFAIAEADLTLRGAGELVGLRQAGLADPLLAAGALELELVQAARARAEREAELALAPRAAAARPPALEPVTPAARHGKACAVRVVRARRAPIAYPGSPRAQAPA